MGGIEGLEAQRKAAADLIRDASAERADTVAHMNEAVPIQRELIRARATEAKQEVDLKQLETEDSELGATSRVLEKRLGEIIKPKLAHAKQYARHKKRTAEKAQADVNEWEKRAKE